MKQIKLSILIPTLVIRRDQRKELLDNLFNQVRPVSNLIEKFDTYSVERFIGELAEIIVVEDNKEMTTGAKRNLLLELSTGDYVSQIDDDDWVSSEYVKEFLRASEANPDCICFQGWITEDGIKRIDWELSKDFENKTVFRGGLKFYERTVNHLCFVKRKIAMQAGFPSHLSNAEDKWFSDRLKNLVHTEVKIKELLYHYRYSRYNKTYA